MTTSLASRKSSTSHTKSTGTKTSRVLVTFRAETQSLEIEPPIVHAKAGGQVVWKFRNPPAGFEPVIQFPGPTPSTGTVYDTGPFQSLCLSPNGITGVVGRRESGQHPYRVVFVPRPGVGTDILDITIGQPPAVHVGLDENPDPQGSGSP
jgi:hypothetical protein